MNKEGKFFFRFIKIGCWWYKNKEIDFVVLNEYEKKVFFVEVKWKELSEREVRGILKDLERKVGFVELRGWEKCYGFVVKKIKGKEELRGKSFLVWDLEDFEDI